MKVFLTSSRIGINACGEYDTQTKSLVVLAGSTLSKDIAYSEKFHGAKSIEKSRDGIVHDCQLQKDVLFHSPSTAANFVTGRSTNGLVAWKDINGRSIKEIARELDPK